MKPNPPRPDPANSPEGYEALLEKLRNRAAGPPAAKAAPEAPARESASESAAVESVQRREAFVKVDTDRLDTLVDTIGELVIAHAMVAQSGAQAGNGDSRFGRNIVHLGKITRELQDLAMGMRMVSLRPTFQKMARIVRDLSVKSGAPMELDYSGEDTEIDRNMVELLTPALVHLVRNAADHGVERPEDRAAAGKPERGRIRLSGYHEGGNVIIRIEDDGRGLDKGAILSRAVSRGVVTDPSALDDEEIFNLIFHDGFSTAEQVTDVSGRGVGMGVVRQAMDELRGRIDISSAPGRGTTFLLRLPLTLAIIDGMVVQVAGERFVIPSISILESLRPEQGRISTVTGRAEQISIRGDLLPLFRLYRLFGIRGARTDPHEALAIIIGDNGSRYALMVDDIIGQQQVVIKALGKTFSGLEGVSGGAIMGDGKVALILDPRGIARTAAGPSRSDPGARTPAASENARRM